MSHSRETRRRECLLAIVGPTATGKTALAIELAREFDGEIVNADSRLVYRGMDIGTAKPTVGEIASVPHHLIDIVEPTTSFNLVAFLKAARQIITDVNARDALPMLVGGSGQYVWAVLEDWHVPEIPVDLTLRAELEQLLSERGLGAMQERLTRLDADAPTKIDMQNPRRVLRGIERAIAAGDATAGATKADVPPYDSLIIGLTASRDELRRRIERRIDDMLTAGWLDEVRVLKSVGLDVSAQSMYSIGYREMLRHISGEIDLDSAKASVVKATMRLVDAQENWFKRSDSRIAWFDATAAGFRNSVRDAVADWHRARR